MKKIILIIILLLILFINFNTKVSSSNLSINEYNNVDYNSSNIIGGISIIKRVNSLSDLNEVLNNQNLPQYLIFELDDNLNCKFSDELTSLDTILVMLNNKVIPVFDINSESAGLKLIDYLNNLNYNDCFVLSKDLNLIKLVRESLTKIGGIIDYTERFQNNWTLSNEELITIRKELHANLASICILPVSLCSHYNIQYLYDSIVNVWSEITDDSTSMIYQGMVSGAIGIITNNISQAYNISCNELNANSMTRLPLNIAHRGLPSVAPENTIEGARLAYQNGADVIELDIYQTTDNQVVIMHDATTSRTCNKDLNVESSTLEELKALYVNKGYQSDSLYKYCKIPTLEEYLIEFKDKDVRLFIEVKSNKESIIPLTKELIDKYDMYDQVSFISFNSTQLKNLNKYFPGCTTGLLVNGIINDNSTEADLIKIKNNIGSTNSTLNPSKDGYGKNAIRMALSRGISVYPWTFNTKADYTTYFMNGYSGLTGNDCRILGEFDKSLIVKYNNPRFTIGDTITFDVSSVKYNDTTTDVTNNIKIKILDNTRNDLINNNTITFTSSGTIDILISYDVILDSVNTYTLYSDVITINVSNNDNNPTNNKTGCNSNTIIILLTSYLISSCIYLLLNKKH